MPSGIEEYEEWEIEATRGRNAWMVSDSQLPCFSKDQAQTICDRWHEINQGIEYRAIGFKCTRERIKVA